MRHRISTGVIVEDDDRVLLVHCRLSGKYDFWVAPGGGVEGTDSLKTTAIREVREECGLEVELGRIAYIEEMYTSSTRICKIWFTGSVVGGSMRTDSDEAAAENIVEAAFLSREDFEGKVVFPEVLSSQYWQDRRGGFAEPVYLEPRRMEDY